MWGMVIGAVAGAVTGAVANGVMTYKNNMKLADAYSKAANQYKEATEKYSGKNAERANQNAGEQMANQFGIQDWNASSSKGLNPYEAELRNRSAEGYNLGSQTNSQQMNANFNKETAESQAALKQAGVDYGVNNQTMQAAMNTAGGLADLYKNSKRNNAQYSNSASSS